MKNWNVRGELTKVRNGSTSRLTTSTTVSAESQHEAREIGKGKLESKHAKDISEGASLHIVDVR